MSYTIPKMAVIDYAAKELNEFYIYGYEWIDNLHFILPPENFLPVPKEQLEKYLGVARKRFREAGWQGDGEIGLLWLPPFVFPIGWNVPSTGVVLWFVKQEEDGLAWFLSPVKMPFEEFNEQ